MNRMPACMLPVLICLALPFVFSACGPGAPPPRGETATAVPPGETPTLTATPRPSMTPTPRPSPTPTASPTATPTPRQPVHAVRLDYGNYAASRSQMDAIEARLKAAGVNWVALGAGRAEWTYFKWPGNPNAWSGDVRDSGIDFLAEDAARFKRWARVDAVVDVFAPQYIAAHPQSAATSWLGKPSQYLVNTMDLVDGEYGQILLNMIEAICANYPVDSVSLTEMMYYTDGYGEVDKAAYMAATGRSDWPRLPNGLVNIDHPSIGEWRSREIARFLGKARAITSRYGKELLVDAAVSWEAPNNMGSEHGTRYDILLEQADRIVVWNYFGLSGVGAEYSEGLARILAGLGPGRIILSVGLWGNGSSTLSAEQLSAALQAARRGGMEDAWVTPSLLMTDAHWAVLEAFWAAPQP